jgi:hypothetical protein
MNTREIEILLEKYYEGETTLAEEQELKDFFLSGDVPRHLSGHAAQFRYFMEAASEESPEIDLDKLLGLYEQDTPVIPLYPSRKKLFYLAGIAAGVVLLIGLVFTFRYDLFKNNAEKALKGTISDPAIAYAETQKALLLFSSNLNMGLAQVERMGSFQRGVEKAENLSKFYKYQKIIINPDEKKNRPQNH